MSRTKKHALLGLVVAALVGVCGCGRHVCNVAARFGSEPVTLQAMTFNIRYGSAQDGQNRWANRREQVIDLLRGSGCDVISLQEALRFQIDEIREALGHYGEVGVGRDDGASQGEYACILYNTDRFELLASETFWFSSTPEVVCSTDWGNDLCRICTWARFRDEATGEGFYVYNVHLDHVSQASREKSVQLLAQRIAQRRHDDPFLVTGDFNAGEDNPAILYLKGLPTGSELSLDLPVRLVDSFRVCHPEATDVGTFHAFAGRTGGSKIDYIFIPAGSVDVLDASVIQRHEAGHYPSDHFPVVATVRFVRSQAGCD